jgi:tripartite-type tricarboxylate transporter receptor subunit TctC
MRRLLISAACAAVALAGANANAQQDYPSRTVRIIAPFAPGASGDLTARTAATFFEKQFKQPFVVENMSGAGGALGAQAAKRAPADGYTLMLGLDGMTMFPLFIKDNTIDLQKDFAPISVLVRFPLVMLGNTAAPAKTLQEFVSYAKANPGKLNFGIVPNSPSQLFIILLANKTGIDVVSVPYTAATALTAALVSNTVQATASVYGSFAANVKAGKISVMGVAGPKRLKQEPSAPTMAEAGAAVNMLVWYALMAPAGTPQPVIQKLAAASLELSKDAEAIERFDKLGIEWGGAGPAELAKMIADDLRDRSEAARIGKIQPQ